MAINKFQRLRLTFQLRLSYWSLSQTIGQIDLKFHVKTPYDKLAKIYTIFFLSHDQDDRHTHIW